MMGGDRSYYESENFPKLFVNDKGPESSLCNIKSTLWEIEAYQNWILQSMCERREVSFRKGSLCRDGQWRDGGAQWCIRCHVILLRWVHGDVSSGMWCISAKVFHAVHWIAAWGRLLVLATCATERLSMTIEKRYTKIQRCKDAAKVLAVFHRLVGVCFKCTSWCFHQSRNSPYSCSSGRKMFLYVSFSHKSCMLPHACHYSINFIIFYPRCICSILVVLVACVLLLISL